MQIVSKKHNISINYFDYDLIILREYLIDISSSLFGTHAEILCDVPEPKDSTYIRSRLLFTPKQQKIFFSIDLNTGEIENLPKQLNNKEYSLITKDLEKLKEIKLQINNAYFLKDDEFNIDEFLNETLNFVVEER